jgi:hypothetical protein
MENWESVKARLLAELERQATMSKYSGMDADILAALERVEEQHKALMDLVQREPDHYVEEKLRQRVEELEGRPVIESEWQALVRRAEAVAAEVERLRLDYDHLDAYLMERTGSMIGWKLRSEAAEAEVARLRDIISPSDAAAYEEGMAALQAALREWREAESAPDCVACCTLDAALCPEVE